MSTKIKRNNEWKTVANTETNIPLPDGPIEIRVLDTNRVKQYACSAYRKGNVVQVDCPVSQFNFPEDVGGECFLFFIPGVEPVLDGNALNINYDARLLRNVCAYITLASWYPALQEQYGIGNGTLIRCWINSSYEISAPFDTALNIGGTFICKDVN